MKIDICIPVFANLPSLRLMAWGLKNHISNPENTNVLLHCQDELECDASIEAFSRQGLKATVVCTAKDLGKPGSIGPTQAMNRLFDYATSPWVIMTEQDFFTSVDLTILTERIKSNGYLIAGPSDTMFVDNPNARNSKMYGKYSRLCPPPGYFHSSLIIINRDWLSAKTKSPFTVPDGFRFEGHGVLGGEHYYGLRLHCGCNDKLAFFRQLHGCYGYGADIYFESKHLGTHLYHSSKIGSNFLAEPEYEWKLSEQTRFFEDYKNNKVKL